MGFFADCGLYDRFVAVQCSVCQCVAVCGGMVHCVLDSLAECDLYDMCVAVQCSAMRCNA